MGNVMSKAEQEQVVALGKLQWSLRKIEEATGCRRETVGKYLRLAGVPVRPPGRWGHAPAIAAADGGKPAKEVSVGRNAGQASQCEEHRSRIAAAVDKGVCARVIWEELEREGFKGGYASVKRFVRKLKAAAAPPLLVGTIETGPGQEAQVDYGEGPLVRDPARGGRLVRTRLFVLTLGWSRKAVYMLALSSSSEEWCSLHERAFRALGGVPAVIVLDNLAEGVKAPDYCDPVMNPAYRQTLGHYDAVAVPARVRDPDRKGKVERGVGYAQLRLEHRTFESLAEAQAFLDDWVATVADVRVHGTTKRVVREHFAEELAHLKPLPLEPCRRYRFGRRKVKSTGVVEVEATTFSAPATHVNLWVQVQFNADVVRLVDDASGALLVEHRRKASAATPATHVGEPEAKKARTSPLDELVQRGSALGPNIGQLCAAIAAVDRAHAPEEFAVRRVSAVLRATTQHGVDHVERACGVAIEAGAPTWRCVRAWLDHHRPTPLAQVDALIRDLTAYRDIAARLSASANTTDEPVTKETA
jgi:transposase